MSVATRLLLTAVVLSTSLEAEPRSSSQTLELTVRVYDYASMASRMLDRTQQQAAEILEKAGLEVRWERCLVANVETKQDQDCDRRADVATIRLNVLSKRMSKKMAGNGIEFGYAVALANGYGVVAGVFYDRTIREADSVGLPKHMMLGHTIAHEIGHLLLGPGSHSANGIMKPNWRQPEVLLAKMNAFQFTADQVARIQEQVSKRVELVAAAEPKGRDNLSATTEIAALR